MSLVVILFTCLLSLGLGYFMVSPLLSPSVQMEFISVSYDEGIKESFKTALDNLDLALESSTISEAEYNLQKDMLLKDASLVLKT